MIDTQSIRLYARAQKRLGIGLLELETNGTSLRLVISHPAEKKSHQPAPTVIPPFREVRSDGLGLLRLRTSPTTKQVRAGDLLAELDNGVRRTPVTAPISGSILAVLAAEGDRIEYGVPLFHLSPEETVG